MINGFIHSMQPLGLDTADVTGFRCRFSTFDYRQEMMEQLPPQARLGQPAVAKRQAEYLAGRLCASACLTELGIKDTWVTTGSHRSPNWPAGIRGSITHTHQEALCICSAAPAIVALGIDLEKHQDLNTADRIAAQILTRQEQQLLIRKNADRADFITRVFSAKEAIFKALYPYVHTYFGFNAVSLVGIQPKYLHFVINQDLHNLYRREQSLYVSSQNEPGQVLSMLIERI